MQFGELETDEQAMLTARIRKRPPRNQWPRKADVDRVEKARTYRAVQELRRIEIAGAQLRSATRTGWIRRSSSSLICIRWLRLGDGFSGSPKASYVPPSPDSRYDSLTGEERLKALETALSSARGGWDESPAGGAADWIRQPGNPSQVLVDFESIPDGGSSFGRVWDRLVGRIHQRQDKTKMRHSAIYQRSAPCSVAPRQLAGNNLRQAINGISIGSLRGKGKLSFFLKGSMSGSSSGRSPLKSQTRNNPLRKRFNSPRLSIFKRQ